MASSWRKIKMLGEGSYGRVDLATTPWCFAAVKSTTLANSSSLETELQFLQMLRNNPYVVQCYGKDISQEEDGSTRYNLLMEYAPCGTLDDLIQKQLDESRVAYYTYLLLLGMSSIHRQGIIHCDIKPKNVLVFENPNGLKHLKLADFGLARYEWEKDPGLFRGTPLYGSPEAVARGSHERATDIWSLGITVLEMLYRGEPMRSASLTNTDVMALTAYKGPPEIPEGVSEVCRDFLSKCLEMEVEDRPSAENLLTHDFIRGNLERIMRQQPGLRFEWSVRTGLIGPRSNPFGSWSNTRGLFSASAAPPPSVVPQYQLFPNGGNAGIFGEPNLIRNQLAI